ncbi:MAG: hypothetical protein HYX82_05290 [Chloroflexi bacterium]|nr:hypothetical protein [Chloroflexota bacterium]
MSENVLLPAPLGVRAEPEMREGEVAIVVTWQPSILAAPLIGGYKIYRREGGEPAFAEIGTVGSKQSSYKDRAVVSGRRYFYSVTTIDTSTPPKESDKSKPVESYYLAPPEKTAAKLLSFKQPQARVEAADGEATVTIGWDALSDPHGLLGGINVYRRDVFEAGEFARIDTVKPGETAYSDREVKAGRTYEYKLSAIDQNSPPRESAKGDAIRVYVPYVVPAPEGLQASKQMSGTILTVTLSWNPVEMAPGIVEYVVYRKDADSAEDYRVIATTAATTFVDAPFGWRFSYIVSAKDRRGTLEGAKSSPVNIQAYDLTPPARVRCDPNYDGKEARIGISWTRPLNIPIELISGYNVYKVREGDEAEQEKLTAVAQSLDPRSPMLHWEDKTVIPGHTYSYSVSALTNSTPPQESHLSPQVSVNIPSDAQIEELVYRAFKTHEEAQRTMNPDLLKEVGVPPWLEVEMRGIKLKIQSCREGIDTFTVNAITVIEFQSFHVSGHEISIEATFNLALAHYYCSTKQLERRDPDVAHRAQLIFAKEADKWLLTKMNRLS